MKEFYRKTKKRVYKMRRHWLTFSFFFGFLLDNLTLNRVDQLFDNLVLLFYVIVAMASVLITYAAAAQKFPDRINPFMRAYAPLLSQFAFGGLLSGMLIFYSRSGSLFESWPFILLLVCVIYGNETIHNRTQRLVFNISMLFVGLFSYVVLIVPVLSGHMGMWIFLGSGVLALLIMIGFIRVLRMIVPNFIRIHLRAIVFAVGTIFVSFNFLYFTNIIPPIPLSLKDIGIYHSVVRFENADEYQVEYEKPEWWQFWVDSDTTFHTKGATEVFCFASVFAPTNLETKIYHHWEYYDEEKGEWISYGRFPYVIEGGRGRGFRGYTVITNYFPGDWRCSVETERGQVIGQEDFTIAPGDPGALVTETR